jgi:hypothetical protein
MVINLSEAQIFKRKVAKALDGVVRRSLSPAHVFE